MTGRPDLTLTSGKNGTSIALTGSWTAPHAARLEFLSGEMASKAGNATSVSFELAAIDEIDTYGAWLFERARREFEKAGITTSIRGVSERNQPLLAEVADTNRDDAPDGQRRTIYRGEQAYDFEPESWHDWLSYFVLLGASLSALWRSIIHPARYRLTSTVYQFDRVGWKALPIVLLVTFIIGLIIAQQGFFHFRRFGADLYIVDMIGFLIMREMGLLLTAIVVAGRSGSSYTAELGSMKMREEIDALKTMGFDPVEVLILPRVLVLVLALPVLTFLGSMAALAGAGLIAITYVGMAPTLFLDRLHEAITLDHFLVGMIKAPFMGLVIGLISCVEGLRVLGSTTSLGTHTTQSVVKSIFMIIVLDGLFALFFSSIRM
ncbi:MAG: ABC transporter permease [Nitratireductor sp.]|nr:ABC transporter permease [Nitratireductor sp.]